MSVITATEHLRNRERTVISRRLHDEIGPTLCAVGLHLGLLRSSLQDDPAAIESIDTIESALNEAIQSVRGMSYRANPGLVRRCGLRTALGYFCRDSGVAFDDTTGLAPLPIEQAEAIYRIACEFIIDAAEAAPGHPLSLRLLSDGLVLTFSSNTTEASVWERFPQETTLLALQPLVQTSFVRIEHRQQSGEVIVSAMMRDARV